MTKEIKNVEEKKVETKLERDVRKKEEGRQELLKAQEKEKKEESLKRDRKIKEIQKKRVKTDEDKSFLKRELQKRAQDNKNAKRNLNGMFPSQMTEAEMLEYCEKNKIELGKDDSTIVLRARIKAFRNPAHKARLQMLERMPVEGKIIR